MTSELNWRKSSHSTHGEVCVEVAATWHKSSYSGGSENCVELATSAPMVLIRDSKNPASGHLSISLPGWRTLARTLRAKS